MTVRDGMGIPEMPEELRGVCDEVACRGWRRVILVGEDLRLGPYTLKACLAQSGVPVLAPGPRDRAWLDELARALGEGQGPSAESATRLAALLADGIEHGVDALLVTRAELTLAIKEAAPDLPLLEVRGD